MRKGSSEEIAAVAAHAGVELANETLGSLAAFAELFLRWNDRINLAAVGDAGTLAGKHLVDAFAAAELLRAGERVIDVGTGGGLPAIPLALLAPDVGFDLHEPTAKKAAFLRTAVRELGLVGRVAVHSTRVERPLGALAGGHDLAMSRATFAPEVWLPLGLDLVKVGGRVLVFATRSHLPALPPGAATRDYDPNRRLLVYPKLCST